MGPPETDFGDIEPTGLEPERYVEDDDGEQRPDAFFRELKSRAKQYKEGAGRAMYMLVMPNGSKYWRLKWRKGGKEQSPFALGVYPEITLAAARKARDEARRWVREGRDPNIERAAAKLRVSAGQALTFKAMAEQWYAEESPGWSDEHRKAQRSRLDKEILPAIGAVPIKDIEAAPELVVALLEKIHLSKRFDVLAKCRVMISQIFRFSVGSAGVKSDPVQLLKGRFKRHGAVKHRSRIPAADMPALFEALRDVPAEPVTRLALYWTILTAARTGETRFAMWKEIESPKAGGLWRISKERMKMEREHVVPLSTIAQEILERAARLRTSKDADALLFPGFTREGSLSENAFLALLARAGFYGRQTTHGFRGSFSTWAHEAQVNPDVIELCLAHVQGGVRGDYNDAKHIPQRRELLQRWAAQCVEWGMVLPEVA